MFVPIFMTRIQVILLFITKNQINDEKRQKIAAIVCEEYCKVFSVSKDEVKVTLSDGIGDAVNNVDLVLDIHSDKKFLNQGSLMDELRKKISVQLRKIFPTWMGFTGRIGTRSGESFAIRKEASTQNDSNKVFDAEQDRSEKYIAEESNVNFERLQLPQSTLDEITTAIKKLELEREIFEEWGLYAIMPNPVCALNFYGPPGTGKTLAAHAVANKLTRKIITASYADIESMYHGEGPKNVQAIFKAAENQNAVLFIDEAESLLSKRLTNVTQGSEQAINSMRSQILICLEKFHGIVIFASNLIVSYDRAFVSRLTSIRFDLPDAELREKIWRAHLLPTPNAKIQIKIPLSDDIDIKSLAEKYKVCGREIRNAVVNACVNVRTANLSELTDKFITAAIEKEIQRREEVANAKDYTNLTSSSKNSGLSNIVKKSLENATPISNIGSLQ